MTTASRSVANVVVDCQIRELYYGTFKAVRDTTIPVKKNTITAFIGPSGCGKSTVLRCINRMNDLVRGFRFEGHVRFRGRDIYEPPSTRSPCAASSAWSSSSPIPFATSIYNNVAFGLRLNGYKGDKARQGGAGPARCRAVGRGERQAAQERPFTLRRTAAAPLHRPGHCHRTRSAADGRALLRAGPHCHPQDRRADAGAAQEATPSPS